MDEKLLGWENIFNKYETSDEKIELILVLAGGLNEEGKLHEWVIRRLDKAIELYKKNHCPIICCGGGTYHKAPYLNNKGFVIHESTECVNYLVQKDIDKTDIRREWSSYDTIANAFFSLTSHVSCLNIKNIAIITSDFHIERSKEIFDWVYNLNNNSFKLFYYSVTDFGLDKTMLKSRKEREKKSRENVINLKKNIKTIEQFYNWFYKEHNAYNNNFLTIETISGECKSSY